jgi:hypothetical protein
MTNSMLTEYSVFNGTLVESKTKPGVFEVEGVVQRAGDKNQNGRVYDMGILKREVDKYIKEFVQNGNAYGELDHPDSPVVNLKNASHVVKSLWWQDEELLGRLELLNTPSGNIVKEILRGGHTIGISSRGTGTVKETNEGYLRVQDDFELVCWDFVSNPSTRGAFMKPVSLNENKQFIAKYTRAHSIVTDLLYLTGNK